MVTLQRDLAPTHGLAGRLRKTRHDDGAGRLPLRRPAAANAAGAAAAMAAIVTGHTGDWRVSRCRCRRHCAARPSCHGRDYGAANRLAVITPGHGAGCSERELGVTHRRLAPHHAAMSYHARSAQPATSAARCSRCGRRSRSGRHCGGRHKVLYRAAQPATR